MREPSGETASKLKSPRRETSVRYARLGACRTSKDVVARGKLVRGSIRTIVCRSPERPLADPSYATAGIVNVPRKRTDERTWPPARRIRSTIVPPGAGIVTYRTEPVGAATPLAPTSTPSPGRPSAAAADANVADATVSTATITT